MAADVYFLKGYKPLSSSVTRCHGPRSRKDAFVLGTMKNDLQGTVFAMKYMYFKEIYDSYQLIDSHQRF